MNVSLGISILPKVDARISILDNFSLPMSQITSPVKCKRRLPITQHRQGLSQQLEIMNAILHQTSSQSISEVLQDEHEASMHASVAKFTANESEASGYTSACSMLNGISGQIHSAHHCSFDKTLSNLTSNSYSPRTENLRLPSADKLVFIDHHSSALRHHPSPDTDAQPDSDIVVMTQSHCLRVPKAYIKVKHEHKKYSKVPWHLAHRGQAISRFKRPSK